MMSRDSTSHSGPRTAEDRPLRIAYVMSRFPKITETFVLREILAVRRPGINVELYPLILEKGVVEQPEVEELRPLAHEVGIFSPAMIPAHLRRFLRSPLRYVRTMVRVLWAHAGTRRAFLGALGTFPKAVYLADVMARRRIDRVHAHFANNPAIAAYVIHALTGIPYGFTAHGSDIHRDQSGLRLKVSAAEFAVMISQYNRRFVAEHCGDDLLPRMPVVHCGIDCTRFSPPDERPSDPDGRLRLLCVAALRAVKGHRTLLEACAILRDRGVPLGCKLVGDGPLREELGRAVEDLDLGDIVTFAGPQPGPEVLRRMQTVDVLVLPSIQDAHGRREGIPVTLMEAMSCETPVVASRISGIPELVEDEVGGLLFEPGNPTALADALTRLRDDPELRRDLGRHGRTRVLEEFRLESCADELVRLFRVGPPVEPADRTVKT